MPYGYVHSGTLHKEPPGASVAASDLNRLVTWVMFVGRFLSVTHIKAIFTHAILKYEMVKNSM